MIALLLSLLTGFIEPTPIDTAVSNASQLTAAGESGAEIVDDTVISWTSEAVPTGTTPKADWLTRLRLRAQRDMAWEIASRLAMAHPGMTITDDMVQGRIGPGLVQRSGITADRCWIALSAPIIPAKVKVMVKPPANGDTDTDASQITLAVLPFKELGPDPEAGIGRLISLLMVSAINAPNVTLVEREDVAKLIEAREFAELDATEDSTGLFVGRLLNARYLLTGTVGRATADEWVLTARIIDSTTGEIVDGHRGAVTFQNSGEGPVMATQQLTMDMGLRSPPGEEAQPLPLHDRATPGTVESLIRAVPRAAPVPLELSIEPRQAVYRDGQELRIRARAGIDGYLTLVAVGPSGNVTVLVPNAQARSVQLRAGESITVPSGDMNFSFPVRPPHGLNRIKAFLTPEPLVVPGSFDDRRQELLKLARQSQVGTAGADPLDNPDWTCREINFVTRPAAAIAE
ncbi:MAG: DUF4384 domain-containing protein [Phycisphaerales bacterium]|nr:DUF4384 domain-containing protein [Phycisphaerales bacterium]